MAPSAVSNITADVISSSASDADVVSSSSSSSGILTRLRSSWSQSQRHRVLAEYYIEADEPHRHYAPGDIVRGAVVLTVTKPIRITHLVVSLNGSVRVFRNGLDRKGRVRVASSDEAEGEGYRSIFQDEMVLCGEGRLDRGRYRFNFELDFPGKRLPSSIDFERGTISYMITSTLTRPTTVGPTSSCERKVHLVETIDVGILDTPKPQTVSLGRTSRCRLPGVTRETTARSSRASSVRNGDTERATTPSLTEFSAGSTSTIDERPESRSSSVTTGIRGLSAPKPSERSVRATVELSRGGCLPGGILTVKINVHHIMPIRSLHGVIITFYRQSRIDPNPWDGGDGQQSKTDYYYPKSKTGLRALSSSAPGVVRKYRMDLCQTVSPLIVNPHTLQATVQASIRVHDDVFPTISSVPGDMVSFKYFVEVALDLKGNLSSQDKLMAHLGVAKSAAEYASSTEHGGSTSTWVGSVVDTERLRREQSVVVRTFEVVIGTNDSSRGKKRMLQAENTRLPDSDTESRQPDEVLSLPEPFEDAPDYSINDEGIPSSSALHPPPPPRLDENTDEKTRIRLAEERLLPSRPPGLSDDDEGGHPIPGPSAPPAPEAIEEHLQSQSLYIPPLIPSHEDPLPSSSLSEGPSNSPNSTTTTPMNTTTATEDKQELERRRLQAAASAPPPPDDDGQGPSRVQFVPTAPILSEEEEEQLPLYVAR
ncbi:MAG: hypothetical protein M1823_005935 [Watsoniomyces obsoletus]|nr:MAG: hypothetical protein M1823_005935 [Watsoniomyces obsoletus]